MKNIFALVLVFVSAVVCAQEEQTPSVEKSVFGVQTGFLGLWAHNETRLSDEVALRSEVGFDTSVYDGLAYDETKYVLVPVISLEPRWYYNLARRVGKDKNIANNSGNFVTIKTLFAPDWFILSNDDAVKPLNQLAFVPKYGMRRVYGKHFTFEGGLGVGIVTYFGHNRKYYINNNTEAFIDLHLRVGYNF